MVLREEEINSLIGQRIRQIREKQKVSQHELAMRCEIEPSNLCRIESGNTNLTVRTMARISSALNVPFYKLTEGIK